MKSTVTLLGMVVLILILTLSVDEHAEATSTDATQCNTDHTISILNSPESAHVLVVAHRGGHKSAPENSVLSIFEAINIGADIAELDVRMTKDNIPVLMHDETVDRTTNGSGLVTDLTFEQLNSLNIKDLFGNTTDEHIPTLSEALDAAKGKILVHVDLKDYNESTLRNISDIIMKKGLEKQVSFYHKNTEILDRVKEYLPDAFLMPMAAGPENAVNLALNKYRMLHLRPEFISKSLSVNINKGGAVSWVNVLNEPDAMASRGFAENAYKPFVDSYVDIIQTDEPEILIDYLTKRGFRNCIATVNPQI